MMNFYELLRSSCIVLSDGTITSRKKVLATLAKLFAPHDAELESSILHKLTEREKLGSTGLGKGVAVPHCRTDALPLPQAALLKTQTGIDYDAPDERPVTLFIGLVVPEQANEEHLQLLAQVVKLLEQEEVRTRLLQAESPERIQTLLKSYTP